MSTGDKVLETTKESPPKAEMAAKGESASVAGRKALLTTVVAIALNPISLVVGYFINHLLQAPKLGIQYVIPAYTSLGKKLGPEGVKALADSPRMNSAIRNTVAQREPPRESNACLHIVVRWTRLG